MRANPLRKADESGQAEKAIHQSPIGSGEERAIAFLKHGVGHAIRAGNLSGGMVC